MEINQKSLPIASLLERIVGRSRLDYCAICGKCLATCPTYNLFYDELHSPRGRLQLVSAYINQELGAESQKFYEAISYCLLCGACETVCPIEIKPNQAIMLIRNLPEIRRRCQPIEKVVLNEILARPAVLKMLRWPLRIYQRSGLDGLLSAIKFPRGNLGRLRSLLPAPQGAPLTSRVRRLVRPDRFNGQRVLFFPGCAMNFLLPDISYSTYQLLLKFGYEVLVSGKFYCCGSPQLHEGFEEKAKELAQKNLQLVDSIESEYEGWRPNLIISDCASCSAMLKSYPLLFEAQPSWREKAQNLAERTFDITEIVEQNIDKLVSTPLQPVRIGWDDPCELIHGQGLASSPLTILNKLPGVEIVTLPESDWCCGSAGVFMLKYPDIAEQILERKLTYILELNLDYLLTSNPGCYLHIKRGLEKRDIETRVVYLTEFLIRFYPSQFQ